MNVSIPMVALYILFFLKSYFPRFNLQTEVDNVCTYSLLFTHTLGIVIF